jgi:hypothetical protein
MLPTMNGFTCENCRKEMAETERATVPFANMIFIAVSRLILSLTLTWSKDICKNCLKQYYVLSAFVLVGLVAVFAFM